MKEDVINTVDHKEAARNRSFKQELRARELKLRTRLRFIKDNEHDVHNLIPLCLLLENPKSAKILHERQLYSGRKVGKECKGGTALHVWGS